MNEFLIDCVDYSFVSDGSLTIYMPRCNMKCHYCNYKQMLKMKNLKSMNIINLKQFMIDNSPFYDVVVISGGEPTIYAELPEIVKLANQLEKEVILYTNLLKFNDDIIGIDKIVVDVKGFAPIPIERDVGISLSDAERLIAKYDKYKNDERFVFRLRNGLTNVMGFKNVEYYDVEKL